KRVMRIVCLILIIVATSQITAAYKILVYNSQYSHSHSNFLGNIADILVDAGHDVTSFIPIIDPSVKDGTSKSKKIFVAQAEDTKQHLSTMLK
ncbi:hypothetical protein PENTCL1PPCAC_12713, partial [Pristionchus entomophagus]